MPEKAGLLRYLKVAFAYRWNLLLFGGATAAAIISGHPDVALPLVAAAEMTYLAGLSSIPRFQAAIDAKAHGETRGQREDDVQAAFGGQQATAAAKLMDVLRSLSEDRRNRFLEVRARCVEMQRIGNAVRGETGDTSGATGELRVPALDRLLWVFLRLLLSDQAISRFLKAADASTILRTLEDLKTKEAAVVARGVGEDDRILRSLRDSVATAELRLDNHQKAQANAEFISVELDRIEAKIQALTEMAISQQDPDAISAQVDAVAEGMAQTEATIRELQTLTGMSDVTDTPSILGANLVSEGQR